MGDDGTINVADAIRIKHDLNENSTYGQRNLNARQIEQMSELDERQVKQLNEALAYIRKAWWLLPDWVWGVGVLTGISVVLFVSRETFPIIGAVLFSGYCVFQLGFRAGHQEGFTRGFEDGNSSGVNKALGIGDEERDNIHERSINIQRT